MLDYVILIVVFLSFICLFIGLLACNTVMLIIGAFSFWFILVVNKIIEYVENKKYYL